MKKYLCLLFCLFLFASCSVKEEPTVQLSLEEIVTRVYQNVEAPKYEIVPLSEDNFAFYAFADYNPAYEAVEADALINAIAHSLVLIKTNGEDSAKLANAIFEHADSRKWICLEAEKVDVIFNKDYVLLVMSSESTVDTIQSNFLSLFPDAETLSRNAE